MPTLHTVLLATLLSAVPMAMASDVPSICVPPNKVDKKNAYQYYDMTSSCQSSGDCTSACAIFIQSDGCGDNFSAADLTDLQLIISKQVTLEGTLAGSSEGKYTSAFDGFTSALPNQNVKEEYLTATSNYLNDGNTLSPRTMYFQNTDKDGGQTYIFSVISDC